MTMSAYEGAYDIENGKPVVNVRVDYETIQNMLDYLCDDEIWITANQWKEIAKRIREQGLVDDFMQAVFKTVEEVIS